MARSAFARRHRARLASGTALVLAVGAVAFYAVTTDGYKAHEADLNDGGVWVVNSAKGWSGRMNNPIRQLDGYVQGADAGQQLDVLQDGAAVVSVDVGASRGQVIQGSRMTTADGAGVSIPADGDLAMGGGSLASVDSETGDVWTARYDAASGTTGLSAVDRAAKPVATAGAGASLAVSRAGTVVVVSTDEREVLTMDPAGSQFEDAQTQDLPAEADDPDQVTTVGDEVVTLDSKKGTLQVLGGAGSRVPAGSVLQQAGPAASSVLVGTPEALLSVDLESGSLSTLSEASGTPVQPVRMGTCAFGAWGGGTGWFAKQCEGGRVEAQSLGGDSSRLTFRVNRTEIVLNDSLSGAIWDVQEEKPSRIDNWKVFTSRKKNKKDDKKDEDRTDIDRRPPEARPDDYGVRAGRATVIHPLDNDSAPQGRLLSITAVDRPTNGATAEISPDGQTLVVTVPEGTRSTTFDYHIDDGRSGLSAHAPVRITVRAPSQNSQPTVRNGYKPRTYHVANGGALSIPVLADWRDDDDGDALVLESAVVAGGEESGVRVRTTSDGRIRLITDSAADGRARVARVDYTVTDGRSNSVKKDLDFRIQAARDRVTHAPKAEPDVVRGEVGKPITIRPLLNDMPGSDPGTPDAELEIGGRVPQQAGLTVRTDQELGTVVATASRAGTYFLNYDAAFGYAPLDKGTIRLDVKPRPKRAAPPVAMPDTLTIFGQAPGTVDVLANDLDPSGGVLAVQLAKPDNVGDLDVAVVAGRWVRISSRQPQLVPATQSVRYTVSNGSQTTQGEVVVTQRPEPADNSPITATDRVVVRAGSGVTIPVLDNDISPSGDRLTLVTDMAEGTPGELRVVMPTGSQGGSGTAYATGRVVRYVAPAGLRKRATYDIPYVAQNSTGDTAEGMIKVTIVPRGAENQPPEPPTIEARVVAGNVVKVTVPSIGMDRDGDSVVISGVTSAPRLGRVLAAGGNSLEYQAFPRSAGTDEFEYAVVDSGGAMATGTVRVAVVEPGEPQPPLAVADQMLVEAGRTAVFDPLANDFIAPGDKPRIDLVDPPEGVEIDRETNLVSVRAPSQVDSAAVQVVYRLSSGLAESRATMTLETTDGYNNPPVVYDSFGRADDSEAIEVDVLEGAYDPDGATSDLRVVEVHGDETAQINGSTVTVERANHPKVVPFRVEDADGAVATASLYVPARGAALPFVKPDALITLDSGGRATGDVTDHIVVPEGADLRVVDGPRAFDISPSALTVNRRGDTGYGIDAATGYRGPGALFVGVTTATDAAGNEDVSSIEDGVTAVLSIPVRVGDDVPELTCPQTTIPLSSGQAVSLDIAALCSVWTPDPRDAVGLDYAASWSAELDGVSVTPQGGSTFEVAAADSAVRGGVGVLDVSAGGSNTQQIRFRMAAAPSPTLAAIPVEDMRAGQSRTIDLARFLQPGVAQPQPTVVSIERVAGSGVTARASGSSITLSAEDRASGDVAFRVEMSDISASDPPAERRVQGRIRFNVGGVPGAPGKVASLLDNENNSVRLRWQAPTDDGGARITHYQMREMANGTTKSCRTTSCSFGGLKTGVTYRFQVRAVNKVGAGEWSGRSEKVFVMTRPGPVGEPLRMVDRGDGWVTIAWDKPTINNTLISGYEIDVGSEAGSTGADQTTFTAHGLDNNALTKFRVRAVNEEGVSRSVEGTFQSAGRPAPPTRTSTEDLNTGGDQTSVRVSWASTLPNGPGPTTYSVTRSSEGTTAPVVGCQKIQATQCTDAGIPYRGATFNYSVTAHNEAGNSSQPGAPASFEAVGRPAEWGAWSVTPTGRDGELKVDATAPASRGRTGVVRISVEGVVKASIDVSDGQRIERLINVPSNDYAHRIQLRIANEREAEGAFKDSDIKSAQSYGPFGPAHLSVVPHVDGKSLRWTVSGTSNGDAGKVAITIDGVLRQDQPLNGPGRFSFDISHQAENFRQEVRFNARLHDDNPAGRGATSVDRNVRAGDPPPPVVELGRGSGCRDGDPNATACGGAGPPLDYQYCDLSSCARVLVQLRGWENWDPTPECRVSHHPEGWFGLDRTDIQQQPTPTEPGWYSPGGTLSITCAGGGAEATGTTSWERVPNP